MPVEEQLCGQAFTSTPSNRRAGQRLFITNRVVKKLAFHTYRTGVLDGHYFFQIRKASDDSLIAEIDMGLCSALGGAPGSLIEGTFTLPVLVNDEVRICQYVPTQGGGGNLSVWNSFGCVPTDQKPGEVYSYGSPGWVDNATYDMVYRYTYDLPVPPTISSVAATNETPVQAQLNGNVDALNDTQILKRGFVWDTVSHADPGNVAPEAAGYSMYWQEAGAFGLGAFSKVISGLHPGPTYYFRAVGENTSLQWAYGSELSFQTPGIQVTEEQTMITNNAFSSVTGGSGHGQRLTITDRKVTKLAFPLIRVGNPGGVVTFVIRRVSDNAVLASKDWGNGNDVPLVQTWEEVTFDAPVLINDEVRIYVTNNAGGVGNLVQVYCEGWGAESPSDVKAGEYRTTRSTLGVWTDDTSTDAPYIYTFIKGAPGLNPALMEVMQVG